MAFAKKAIGILAVWAIHVLAHLWVLKEGRDTIAALDSNSPYVAVRIMAGDAGIFIVVTFALLPLVIAAMITYDLIKDKDPTRRRR